MGKFARYVRRALANFDARWGVVGRGVGADGVKVATRIQRYIYDYYPSVKDEVTSDFPLDQALMFPNQRLNLSQDSPPAMS